MSKYSHLQLWIDTELVNALEYFAVRTDRDITSGFIETICNEIDERGADICRYCGASKRDHVLNALNGAELNHPFKAAA